MWELRLRPVDHLLARGRATGIKMSNLPCKSKYIWFRIHKVDPWLRTNFAKSLLGKSLDGFPVLESSSDFSLFSAPRCAFTWKRSYTLADRVRTTSLFPRLWRCLPVIYGAAWQEIRSYHRVTSWNHDWFSAVPPRFHRLFDLFDQSYFRLINLLTRGAQAKTHTH